MDESDPFRGTNPWSLSRFLRGSLRYCPACRKECHFDVNFDTEEEVITITADCDTCGNTELSAHIDDGNDVFVGTKDGKEYEPSNEACGILAALGDSEVPGSGPERLEMFGRLASVYASTRRTRRAADMERKVSAEYRTIIGKPGSENANDMCLEHGQRCANVLMDSGRSEEALKVYEDLFPLTEGSESGKAYSFILARAFAVFSTGETKEPTAWVRSVIGSLDRMRSEGRIPQDDPFIRSRAYEALGVLLSAKNDKTGSMKAMKKCLEDCHERLSAKVTDEGLRWMNRCSREYAFACFQADMKKRSMEALKDSVKTCAANRETYPGAYAESLLERAMFISDSGMALPPYLRKDMDEAIDILRVKVDGKYDPLLPVAYYYRSMTGADKEKLDISDLESAYDVIREGTGTGDIPDSVLGSVMETYVTYLDAYDEANAAKVRRELAEMGIFVHPPVKKKPATA